MLLGIILAAQAASAAPADLSAFRPFIGACWRADFTATVRDTHCFEAMYGGAHVVDRHEVQDGGKTVYAGETIYSADGADVVFTYVNSTGGVGQGKMRAAGSVLTFVGNMRGSPADAQQPIDSEWRVIDADHYEVLAKQKSGAANKPLTFKRVPKPRQK
jgi:hypothetical protein